MFYNKASFRAARERLGLTQQNIADMVGVTVLTVKKWERASGPAIPTDVQTALHDLEASFDGGVESAMLSYMDAVAVVPGGSPTVEITYFRSQVDYDSSGRDEGPFGYVNAMSRVVASALSVRGIGVRFVYPDERMDGLEPGR